MNKSILLILLFTFICGGIVNAQVKDNVIKLKQKGSIIKINPLSFYLFTTAVSYEQKIKPNASAELRLGIIGAGHNPWGLSKEGFFLTAGPRFYLSKKYKKENDEMPLSGAYFKPEVIFSKYKSALVRISQVHGPEENFKASSGAILANIGHQFALWNILVFDFSAGVGAGFRSHEYLDWMPTSYWESISDTPYFFSHMVGGKNFPMALKANLSLGILF